jgi:hypothetical protein
MYLYVAFHWFFKPSDISFFDMDWNEMPFSIIGHPRIEGKIKKPDNFDKMLEISRKLSKDFMFVRVDMYNVNGHIYFGELTFTPHAGLYRFDPPEWNKILGDCLRLESTTIKGGDFNSRPL